MPDTELTPLARALGRIPTGLYIVSVPHGTSPLGLVGSLFMQVGLDPPTVCIAVGRGRDHLEAMRQSGSFAVSILDADSRGLMGGFFKPPAEGETPFDTLNTGAAPSGAPVLLDALAWLDCKVTGEHPVGDHAVVFGEVTAGELRREADPAIHLRKNGLDY